MTSSVLSPKCIYLIVPKIKKICNLWSVSKSIWVAEVLIKFYIKRTHQLPEITIFRNFCKFAKIYVTIFVSSKFWWIDDCGFNGIKHIFIQIFVQIELYMDYTTSPMVN